MNILKAVNIPIKDHSTIFIYPTTITYCLTLHSEAIHMDDSNQQMSSKLQYVAALLWWAV